MAKDFITIQEAAEYLGKSAQTVRRMIKREELTAKRIRTPQGFHYVLSRDEVIMEEDSKNMSEVKNSPLLTTSDNRVSMLNNTTVQKPISTEEIEEKVLPTSQNQIPTNQTAQHPHKEAIKCPIDKNDLARILERHHKENIRLFSIIEKLQYELDKERRKPKGFFAYFFDWLSH